MELRMSNFLNKILDFKFYKENYLVLLALVFSVFFIKIFNLSHIIENSTLENIQLIALFAGFIFCFKTKKYKTFFTFLALILFLMMARELSYGRVFFARIPGESADGIYPWSHFKYGYLAHIIIGIYIGLSVLYALIKKIWVDIIDIIKNIAFPFWTFLISFGCVFVQLFSEKVLHNSCVEETAEFMLYCSILVLILIYRKK